MPGPKPTTVDEYIENAPPQAKDHLREIRSILRAVAPDAREAIKWGYPVLEEKRILAKSMYDRAGFQEVARRKPARPVVRIELR